MLPENVELQKQSWVRNPFLLMSHNLQMTLLDFRKNLSITKKTKFRKKNLLSFRVQAFGLNSQIPSRESEKKNCCLPGRHASVKQEFQAI
jgi:hypothetical protein